MTEEFKLTPPDEFTEAQALRRREKLVAAKKALQDTLYDLASDRGGREPEAAADAIENLIRTIIEER